MHPAFARKRLEAAILSAGVAVDADDASDFVLSDGAPALAILLGNRARNGEQNGDVPAALRDLLAAEKWTLPGRAEGALRFAEAHALGVAAAASKRTVHMAGKIAEDGGVSARCFARPRKIDMSRETWTADPAAVTCPGCKAKIGGAS